MFDPAAFSLPSPLLPAPIAAHGAVAENAVNAGEMPGPTQAGGFESLLALQSALAFAPPPATADPAIAASASGKILPVPAMPVAAAAAAGSAQPVTEPDTERADRDIPAENTDAQVTGAVLADPAMIAAIFAAPERLGRLPVEQPQPQSSTLLDRPANPKLSEPARILPLSAKPQLAEQTKPAPLPMTAPATATMTAAVAASVAIAQAAVIKDAVVETAVVETTPTDGAVLRDAPADKVLAPATPSGPAVMAERATRPVTTTRAAQNSGEATIAAQAATAMPDTEEGSMTMAAAAPDIITLFDQRTAEAAPSPQTVPATRAEPRAERMDFATLVETLNRAREEASPTAVRVSVAHADFGRVSMRFEQDDMGLSVAMSSADPGFARAVTASNEAASATNDTAREQTPQSQAQSQAQARGGNGASGEGARQNPHDPRTATPDRPAAQLRDAALRDDDTASPGGIFA
ncbi:MAG: hypothetical protein C0409_06350 [Novosphingobium sp.]|nr:hypothetical protein [Novosphingobium sp.]